MAEPIKKHNNTDKNSIEDEREQTIYQVFVFIIVQNNETTEHLPELLNAVYKMKVVLRKYSSTATEE